MTPDFKVIAAGINITSQISDRLLGLTVNDEIGTKTDQVEIALDDRGNAIDLPPPGAPLLVAMGYKEAFLMPMGLYTADEVVAKGPPDTVTIRGKAADLGGTIKEQKTRAWDDKTIEEIVTAIAGEHELEPKVAEVYADFHYDHLDQTDESDINLLIRIAKDHDALATVKGGSLLFVTKGEGKTASGLDMLPIPITKSGKIAWSMTFATREDFNSVSANWHDQATGKKEKVTEGDGAPVKKLRHTYANEGEARASAKAALAEIKRSKDTLSMTMPGNPAIAAGGQILAIGFRAGVNGTWSIKSASHRINSGGFTTSIECEKPN